LPAKLSVVTEKSLLHYIETMADQMEKRETTKVLSGHDRFDERRSLGISAIEFKLCAKDTGGLFVLENVFHAKGGPARHLHYDQDEWFYCLEGDFVFEVGPDRFTLKPGDSLIGPKRVPHVWAHVGSTIGRILVAFSPAGRMEAFFREVTKANAMPPQDQALWRAHGMELLGPPMTVPQ
jgi:mannose-6-phosphate isomerase-like protein (cupin superfamily)